jgi:DNA-binding NtrC family response regulator
MNDAAILVVDDDADVLKAARIALSMRFDAIDVADSIEAIEQKIDAGHYDAVLLDMNYAAQRRDGSAGMDALARVLATDADVSVILMTAYGSVGVAVEALKRGAVDFVLKPWANDKLMAAVVAAVEATRRKRAADHLDIETLEKRAIQEALARSKGNLSLAATALGLSRPALYRRLAKYGLLA